jgi:class 3 adenylate cyclase
MSERLNRTSVCTVIFIGIVDYAQLPVDDQIALKESFNALIGEAIRNVPANDRIILDTGDGAAIALLGAPEDAVAISLGIRERLADARETSTERTYSVRIGINLGPVRVVNDLNGRRNVVGDGINAAQRVMSFAQPNRILVSRSYYEIASRLSAEMAQVFTYHGMMTDKYVREYEVYSVLDGNEEPATVAPATPPAREAARTIADFARKRWMPALLGAMLVALAWGWWISRPAETTPSSMAAQEARVRDAANTQTAQTASEQGSSDQEGPRAQETGTQRQAAPGSSSSSRQKRSTARRNALCSEAQRMLKQC